MSVYDGELKLPFGSERVKALELLYQIVRIGKPIITQALSETKILADLLRTVETYPWNNIV